MVRLVAAGVLSAITVTGCTGRGVPSGGPPAGAPPGTRLAGWLVSPPDTQLLGAAFPNPHGGFDALLLVRRRPLAVVADVLAQASREGYEIPRYDDSGPDPLCEARSGGDWDGGGEAHPIDRQVSGDTHWLSCSMLATALAGGEAHRSFNLELIVGSGDDPYLSHLWLSESTSPWPRGGAETVAPPTIPPGAVEPEPPPYPDRLPGPGDRLGRRYAPDNERYRVLPGSALLAPEFPATGGTGGFHAVLRLDEATVDDYDEIARATAFHEMGRDQANPDVTLPIQGGIATYRAYSGGGAGDLILRTVRATGGDAYLMISRQGD